jgi:malto-oligosyltrehalose trehalohydrolase
MTRVHTIPFGAHFTAEETAFRLWAPGATEVDLIVHTGAGNDRTVPLSRGENGLFSGRTGIARPGSRYHYRIDNTQLVPDPASRFQPEDVHGPSEVVDPGSYRWQLPEWRGRPWEDCILYELHIGTFTSEGTFNAAIEKLDHLASIGITAIEIMPVADFSGTRGWGYDGVLPYAPDSSYGRPDDLKRLVDAAHSRGIMVFLDVVYNHFGPDGNYLWTYAGEFFTSEVTTPWGDAIDFRKPAVREFFIHNALYWIEEYFIDGLRLDAVHAIHDPANADHGTEHFLNELARRVHEQTEAGRHVHLVLENDRNDASLLEPGRADTFTAQWNDDFHHAAHTLATGESNGYYATFAKESGRLLRKTLTEGFVRRNSGAHLPPTVFINFLQNHDQIGNRALGERLTVLCEPELLEALICIQCLAPHIPLLFMGEEWGATTPFQYFCDFHDELAEAVRDGRRREFASFPQFRDPETRRNIPDPNDKETRNRSVLRWKDAEANAGRSQLYRTLFALRRRYLAGKMSGATFTGGSGSEDNGVDTFIWRLSDGSSWTLLSNLSAAEHPVPADAREIVSGSGERVFVHPAAAHNDIDAGTVPEHAVAAYHAGPEDRA